ncbi:MAG: cobalamin-independent methionine synthase II family protein, partial [Phycisphaerae bacterium]|nr:cobalamin-independent methionine synthase II family protein [Phycisphaerae bacterium]MDW8263574.1 cobalamin-independent methionine synthase II family protein [Phycisphaerales bacterium]
SAMPPFTATVVGSYPRNTSVEDTLKKPSLTRAETDALITWAAKDQAALGLDVITDGEGYRENMYYFYQKRLDGISFQNMVKQSFGTAGFAIECARVVDEIRNPRFELARNWKLARDAAPTRCRVKQTVTGPHVLTRFSVNERKDLYPDAPSLCRAYARVLAEELREVIAAGCDYIQFDEPMWTEAPQDSPWAAEILNELIESLPKVRVGLHVCGGNPRRKRVYFTKYTDLVPAFRKVKIDEVSLEYCTLGYDLMELWNQWDFRGDLSIGVIDQRSDEIEDPQQVRQRVEPVLKHFPPDRLLLTSECGFGHVPLEITRKKLSVLVEACRILRSA